MLNVSICLGSACHLKGSYQVIEILKEQVETHHLEEKVNLQGAFCLGHCTEGVCVKINDNFFSVSPTDAKAFFEEQIKKEGIL